MAKFCPSLMCADFSHLADEILRLEDAGADMFHIDIMDGQFVPNFSMGLEDVKAIQRIAKIPFDIHLAVVDPDLYIEKFAQLGCELIYIHAETTKHLHRTLSNIANNGVKVGVALNPATPLCILDEVLPLIDVILVMSVNPGFAGQPFIFQSIDRINRLNSMIKERGTKTKIAIDGAVSEQVVAQVCKQVEYFILGTAGLFRKDRTYQQAISTLRAITG